MVDKEQHEMGKIQAIAILVSIVAVTYFVFWPDKEEPKAPPAKPKTVDLADYHGMAQVMAEDFVSRLLKSPGSAEFSSYSESDIRYKGGGRYRVKGFVDSQNSFGAMLRNHYMVDLFTTNGKNWLRTAIHLGTRAEVERAAALIDNPPPKQTTRPASTTTAGKPASNEPHKWQDSKGYWHFADEDPDDEHPNKVSGTEIYKWQDEEGNWHFSDKGIDQ